MDQHENPMIAEGQAQMIRQERIPEEEEREERPERCEDCKHVTSDEEGWLYCEHPESILVYTWMGRSLPPSLKGEPPDWCPWEEE